VTPWIAAAKVYFQPKILRLVFLGFSSGLPLALTFSTLSVWLAEHGVQKSTIGLFAALGIPYTLKFLWAPLIDRAKLPFLTGLFGRRRAWMLFSQGALVLAIFALGQSDPSLDAGRMAMLALVLSFCSASQDIVLDAYRVETLDERTFAAGAAVFVWGYRIAMLVSGAGALYIASGTNWAMAYTVMAGLMGVGIVMTLFSPEPDLVENKNPIGGNWFTDAVAGPFAEFMMTRGWMAFVVLAFVVCYKLGDSMAGVMTNPFLVELGFSKIEIANVSKVYGFTATMAGLAIGGWLLNASGLVKSLWICGVLQLLSNLMFAAQAEVGHSVSFLALTIGFENLSGGMGTAIFIAYLSSLCNISYTATQYALLSSLFAIPRTLISSGTGYMAEAVAWTDFFIYTAVAAVPGLLILWFLTRRGWVTRST
jgi:MFS transporter, PAT family, beta-lactamase induction signal transducer AmpG